MNHLKKILPILLTLWLAGCGEKPVTKLYPQAKTATITCLRLDLYPPNGKMEQLLKSLYPFASSCETVLEVRHKENICCNSNQNAPRKALSSFPHNFLRMEVRHGLVLLYSYYIDLNDKVDEKDLRHAFERVKRDLNLK